MSTYEHTRKASYQQTVTEENCCEGRLMTLKRKKICWTEWKKCFYPPNLFSTKVNMYKNTEKEVINWFDVLLESLLLVSLLLVSLLLVSLLLVSLLIKAQTYIISLDLHDYLLWSSRFSTHVYNLAAAYWRFKYCNVLIVMNEY
jgi:hypothetical protein